MFQSNEMARDCKEGEVWQPWGHDQPGSGNERAVSLLELWSGLGEQQVPVRKPVTPREGRSRFGLFSDAVQSSSGLTHVGLHFLEPV